MLIQNIKKYFADSGLSVESASPSLDFTSIPPARRMIQFFNTQEVRDAVNNMFLNSDLLVGGTFSGMPVVGVITLADSLNEEEMKKIHENDERQTKNLWRSLTNENYFKDWKDWSLYYNNVVSALSGFFCLRYFVFEKHENFEKYKKMIKKMKIRQFSPVIGVYGFACDATTGEVTAPNFTFWWGAGAFRPKNISKFLTVNK